MRTHPKENIDVVLMSATFNHKRYSTRLMELLWGSASCIPLSISKNASKRCHLLLIIEASPALFSRLSLQIRPSPSWVSRVSLTCAVPFKSNGTFAPERTSQRRSGVLNRLRINVGVGQVGPTRVASLDWSIRTFFCENLRNGRSLS
jgi:hypothetical protein